MSVMTQIETNVVAVRFYVGAGYRSFVVGQQGRGRMVRDLCTNVLLASGQSRRRRDRDGGMNGADTLRAAAHALNDHADLAHAPALAGLLHNRADDMERNIALWRRCAHDIPTLVQQHYGMYLAVARVILVDPRAAPFPQTS
jgi:hypothetical protein